MSKSTPINQISSLPSNNGGGSGGDESMQMPIVQDILNEIQHTESMTNMSTPSAMTNPPAMTTQDGRTEFNVPSVNYQMDPNIQPLPNQGFQNLSNMPNMLQYQQQLLTPPKTNEFTLNKLIEETKLPLLTGLIYLIMASPRVVSMITNNIAFTATEGVINTTGYIFIAIIVGILFYVGNLLMNKISN